MARLRVAVVGVGHLGKEHARILAGLDGVELVGVADVNAEQARISRRLVTLDQNVALEVPVEDLAVHEPDYKHLIAFLKAMEFSTLTRRVAEKSGVDASEVEADLGLSAGGVIPPPKREGSEQREPGAAAAKTAIPTRPPAAGTLPLSGGGMKGTARPGIKETNGSFTPQALATAHLAAAKASKIDRTKYEIVRTLDRLNHWLARARDLGVVAVDTETTSLDPMQAHLCGFSLAVADNEACYVPIGHLEGGVAGGDLFNPDAKLSAGQLPERPALDALKTLLEDLSVLKVGQNLKYDWLVFARR